VELQLGMSDDFMETTLLVLGSLDCSAVMLLKL
jgi:hypothetical protein